MSDERLDKLGRYFVQLQIREKYGITFARFVETVKNGTWKDAVA